VTRILAAALALAALAGCSSQPTAAPAEPGAADGITKTRMAAHLQELQRIADANGGTRTTASPGHQASLDYVERTLRTAGLDPKRIPFDVIAYRELAPPALSAPGVEIGEIVAMEYSGSGTVTGPLVPVGLDDPLKATGTSTSGCAAADFRDFPAGAVALVQRGGCFLAEKAANAAQAGAKGAIVMNDGIRGHEGAIQGTLIRPARIPVLGVDFDTGVRLAKANTVSLSAKTETEKTQADNLIADLPGTGEGIVLLGAHLDSVPAGPGVNDDGSGVATLLEVARALRGRGHAHTIRLAFWGGEELGLVGSTAYVNALPKDELHWIDDVVNLDMVGSENGGRFVFDGNGSSGGLPGPPGSGRIETALSAAFDALGLSSRPIALEPGRSDYAAFAQRGIAIGGLFSGADGVKTASEAKTFGGDAGSAYDDCYHRGCDRADHVDVGLATDMARAAAIAALALARG
jgi:Zn-dependent M28 family amino/carboxypeptidase